MGRRRNRGSKKRGGKTSYRRFDPDDNSKSSSDISIDYDIPLFDIGTRVELPCLKGYASEDGPRTGTVAGHWKRRDFWPENRTAPYLVLLDDGMAIYSHRTDEEFIRRSDVSPMEVSYNIGCHIECKLEDDCDKWFPGTVIQCHDEWHLSPIDTPPYLIRFDYGRDRPFWGPEDRIRASNVCKKKKRESLRFGVGEKVECMVDEDWVPGQVIKLWYVEDEFENGYAVPYQVRLVNGDFIYAPVDDNTCIRKCHAPDLPLRFAAGDRVECSVDDGWMPGTVLKIHYQEEDFEHGRLVPYQVKLFMGDLVYAPMDNDSFIRAANIPLRFDVGDRVDCSVDDEWMTGTVLKTQYQEEDFYDGRVIPYKVQLDDGDIVYAPTDDDLCIKQSAAPPVCRGQHNGFVHVVSRMLIYNEEYDDAKNMLEERIALIKSKIEDDKKDSADLSIDLSSFLIYLAEVHQAVGSLEHMKQVLDEALAMIEASHDKYRNHRLLNVTAKLATHAALTSDRPTALKYSEDAIVLVRDTTRGHDSFRLGLMLLQCGKLNVSYNNRERGLSQMTEGLQILSRLYGTDNKDVMRAKEDLRAILEGSEDC